MKPVIGVVADVNTASKHTTHTVQHKYLAALTQGAGARAIIIPADLPGTTAQDLADLLATLDGLLLTGALSNVAPSLYNATLADPASPADPARDATTLPLIRQAVAAGLPTLGICRGFQEINVALGGTLLQSVHTTPGLADHRDPPGTLAEQYAPAHDITLTPGGLLHSFTGMQTARVNSLHHQGIDRLAPPLAIDATAPDGLPEAIRLKSTDTFLLGVQWHPEWQHQDDPLSTIIFRAFGTAARAHQQQRQHARRPATPDDAPASHGADAASAPAPGRRQPPDNLDPPQGQPAPRATQARASA